MSFRVFINIKYQLISIIGRLRKNLLSKSELVKNESLIQFSEHFY